MTTYIDNSRIKIFRLCPRKYYFRYIKDLIPKYAGKAPALVFGSCWHAALSALYVGMLCENLKEKELYEKAENCFMLNWEQETGSTNNIPLWKARNPSTAYAMLNAYINERYYFLKEIELIRDEQPFFFPLNPEKTLYYIGRIDKIVRWQDKIWLVEHKTTTKYAVKGGFKSSFLATFESNSQVEGYMAALKIVTPDAQENLGGVLVDIALVHTRQEKKLPKAVTAFKLLPIYEEPGVLEAWYKDLKYWIQQLQNCQDQKEWPRNVDSCHTDYGTCPYHNICSTVPTQKALDNQEDFFGYEKSHWEPFDLSIIKNGE